MVKNYVLDTNILLTSPNAILGFEDNNVYLTSTTLSELDSKKSIPSELGFNARTVLRLIENLRKEGLENDELLITGVSLSTGGKLFIENNGISQKYIPNGFDIAESDNKILSSILYLTEKKHEPFILVSNDTSFRIKASICGVEVQEYMNDHQITEHYTGKATIELSKSQLKNLLTNESIDYENESLIENEFVEINKDKDGDVEALAMYRNKHLGLITPQKVYGITPLNTSQTFALEALLAPAEEIPLVILTGPAGAAKTFLSLAAGLEQVSKDCTKGMYDKIMITRNNITSDSDFGALPGDLEDKMMPLLAPFYDNIEALIRANNPGINNEDVSLRIDDLFASGTIKVCAMAYMRGRSISNTYLIVDEAQNSTKTQMRDIITRAGKGTKVVICGDPSQIDNHLLDKYNNGLVYASENMKGAVCAQVTFENTESVRSILAAAALKQLPR